MDKDFANKFYSREDIQREILKYAKNREIGVRYDGYFGKRPDTIEFLSDVKKLVKNGVFSFHSSEERWANPLMLGNDVSEEEKFKNRIGWDLILDLDGVDFEYAKIIGKLIIDFLYELGVRNFSTKFSGNKGFHIGIPFEAFSQNIIGIGETRNLFPNVAKRIVSFLMSELEDKLINEILKRDGNVKNIAKKYGFLVSDLTTKDGKLDYMKLIEIDTILISSRHLFRMPYSLNEKSSLVSVPLNSFKIMDFTKDLAEANNVDPKDYKDFEFLNYESKHGKDADILLIKSYEEDNDEIYEKIAKERNKVKRGEKRGLIFTGNYETVSYEIEGDIELKDFPKTIDFILNNKFKDGRKRALFVLLTFLYSVKWNKIVIEEIVKNWDSKQDKSLGKNYTSAQINWFDSRDSTISPPNFSNDNYYKSIGIPEEIVNEDIEKFGKLKIKNPLHYIYILLEKNKKDEEIKKKAKLKKKKEDKKKANAEKKNKKEENIKNKIKQEKEQNKEEEIENNDEINKEK